LNVEPRENHSRRWNGQNIELASLSSNYLILPLFLLVQTPVSEPVGMFQGFDLFIDF
jgi:hypothetical protein